MDAYGLLKNIADVDKVAPFQKWARDLYELRQRNFLKDDPMYLFCMPPGGPRQYQLPWRSVQRDRDPNALPFLSEAAIATYRIIYTDGRPQQRRSRRCRQPANTRPSAGKWEGEKRFVDLKGFNEKFWFSNGGLPHTEQLHLIERYTRTDMNTLKYEVTIDDPGAYTKTWTAGWNLKWIAGEELPVYYCQDNRP
jgi:hypothetical protein